MKRHTHILTLVLLFACALGIDAQVSGDLLNIDFGQAGNPAFRKKQGPAAVGLDETDFWNDFGGGASSGTGLKWSDGTASPITVSGGGENGQWYTWTFDAMFQSYVYSSGPMNFNLSGTPAGAYDFYVYAHGQVPTEATRIVLQVGATTLPSASTSLATDWDKPNWTEGNHYVVFRGVNVSAGQSIVLAAQPISGNAALNGLQILKSSHTNFAPVILENPRHKSVIAGGTARFEGKIFGTEPLQFQWQRAGTNIEGATARFLELTNVQSADTALYTLSVSNEFGSTLSADISLQVLEPVTFPLINIDVTDASNPFFSEVKTGAAAIGASNTDFWNRLTIGMGPAIPLKFADGSDSGGIQATLIGPLTMFFTENRDPMYFSFAASANNIPILIQGLPAARYNFLAYAHGQKTNQGALIEVRVGVNSFGVKSTSSAPDWDKPAWTEGSQYVRFNDVTVPAGANVYITSVGSSGLSTFNGLQIVKAPQSPPSITTDLAATSIVNPGASITLQVIAEGDGLTYQWLKNDLEIEGATASSLTVSNAVATDHDGNYRVRVTDRFTASTMSSVTALSVKIAAPQITTQPASQFVSIGGSFELSVVATGLDLTYQWQKDGVNITNASSASYAVTSAAAGDSGQYRVKITNPAGETVSQSASVVVGSPAINLINVNFGHVDSVKVGKAAFGVADTDFWNHYSFPFANFGSVPNLKTANNVQTSMGIVVQNGPGQWYSFTGDKMYDSYLYSGGNITVTLTNVPPGRYHLYLYGHGTADNANTRFEVNSGAVSFGSQATTKTAAWNSINWQRNIQYVLFEAIDVGPEIVITCRRDGHSESFINGLQLVRVESKAPLIFTQPRSTSVSPGRDATFNVSATGESIQYQWRKDGTNLTESAKFIGVTQASLQVKEVSTNELGQYSVLVTNPFGEIVSANAALTIVDFNLLSINFGHQDQVKVGPAATGISSEDFWNHYTFPFASFASMTNLQMVNRSSTPIGLTVANAPGQWTMIPVLGDLMYDGFLYSDGDITVTLFNVPPGAYDLYLYGHAGVDNGNSKFTVLSGTQNLGSQATTVTPGLWNSINWQRNAQYVLFENFQHNGDPIVITVENDGHAQAFLNGLQLKFKGEILPGPPQIFEQPKSLRVSETRKAEFKVGAWGIGAIDYQWRHEGTNLPAGTNSVITYASAEMSHAGNYEVVVSNQHGSVTSSNVTLIVEGADHEAPVVTITSPVPGGVAEQVFTLEGTATDNQTVTSVRWELNGVAKGALTLDAGKFKLNSQNIIKGVQNRLKVYAKDDFDNEGVAEVVFFWDPPRVFALQSPSTNQEGSTITVPLNLISKGDVSGATFLVKFDTNYLAEPVFEWSEAMIQAFVSAGMELNRQFRASFAMPAITIPGGTTTVARVTFRLRSVPNNVNSPLTLELVDVYGDTGDQFTSGNDARSATVSITKRKIKGDNNANHRLDVGDASVILRLVSRLDPVRPWDTASNDLNVNNLLDSGDVIRVLRAVVGLDPQPIVPGALRSFAIAQAGTAGPVQLIADKATALAGEKVTVEVRLADQTKAISGASFRIEYPVDALRLENSTAHVTGSMVPTGGGATAIWNVSPSQNNYTTQDGIISLGVSSSTAWPSTNGVLARLTFTVQSGATSRFGWPVQLKNVEVATTTGQIQALPQTAWTFIAREPIASTFAPSVTFSAQIPRLTLQGDLGATYRIEASSDVRNWETIGVYYNSTGTLLIDDPAGAGAQWRFYRAILQQ